MRELFDDAINRLLGDLVTPELLQQCEAGHWPAALWAALETSGFAVAAAPEAMGGAGASWGDLYGVVLAAGRHNLPLPLPETLLANALLGQAGLQAVNAPLGLGVAGALQLVNGRVNGTLSAVPWGRHVTAVVAISGGPEPAVLLLDRSAASCRLGDQQANIAGEPRDDLHFSNAQPLASAPLPAGPGADVLHTAAAMLRAAQTAGALQAVLAMTVRYAGERVQFGKPLASFQALQQQIAQLAEHSGAAGVAAECAFVEASAFVEANAFVEASAFVEAGGGGLSQLPLLPIAAARVVAAEAAGLAAAVAHTVHGAIGFTHEHALHWSTRRLWSWRSDYGNASHWAQRLGRSVCSGGAAALWPAITAGQLDLPAAPPPVPTPTRPTGAPA